MDMSSFANDISEFAKRNSPAILSGVAIAGVVTTAILAVRGTPKAIKAISNVKDEKAAEAGPLLKDQDTARSTKLPPMEIFKATWKFYIPAGVTGAITIACIVASNKIETNRNAALVAAYALADNTFREYKDKVLEELGPKKEEAIQEKVAAAQIEKAGSPSKEIILSSGSDVLCFEAWTGRYFRSDADKIRHAEVETNFRIGNDMYASLNEFYDELNLEHTEEGEVVGWNMDNRVKLAITSHLHPDGIPALAFSYVNNPRADFGKCF